MAPIGLWKFWLVDSQESSSQELLKGFKWNLVYMFLWRSLTSVDTFCTIWNFKMATNGGQSLHWKPMGNIISISPRTVIHNFIKAWTHEQVIVRPDTLQDILLPRKLFSIPQNIVLIFPLCWLWRYLQFARVVFH